MVVSDGMYKMGDNEATTVDNACSINDECIYYEETDSIFAMQYIASWASMHPSPEQSGSCT